MSAMLTPFAPFAPHNLQGGGESGAFTYIQLRRAAQATATSLAATFGPL